jgi:hypothetical protein
LKLKRTCSMILAKTHRSILQLHIVGCAQQFH